LAYAYCHSLHDSMLAVIRLERFVSKVVQSLIQDAPALPHQRYRQTRRQSKRSTVLRNHFSTVFWFFNLILERKVEPTRPAYRSLMFAWNVNTQLASLWRGWKSLAAYIHIVWHSVCNYEGSIFNERDS